MTTDKINLKSALNVIVENIVRGVTDFIPRTLMAVTIVALGWVVAKIIQKMLRLFLTRIHFDNALQRLGIDQSFKRIGVRSAPTVWVPRIIYYLILVFMLRMAAQAIGLVEVAEAINTALSFVPNIVAGLIIVLLGSTIGQFAGKAVESTAGDSGIEYSSVLGRLTYTLIFFVVTIMAISQLRINMEIVNSVVLIIFSGLGLAFALSFGLGTRDLTRNIIAGFYARKIFSEGDEIEINGERGAIKSITPVVTILRHGDRDIVISNSVFLSATGKHP